GVRQSHSEREQHPLHSSMAAKLPLREEFEQWTVEQVAEFLKQFGMHQCTGVVEKFELNGSQFLNMTEVELSKFNILHQPRYRLSAELELSLFAT
ncbi:hypothetical protein NDU88_007862, partial [Pleurodeles waltl]